jgi:hypothetical protein
LHLSIDGDPFKPLARVASGLNQIQFVDPTGTKLLGSAGLTWDDTGKVLTVAGIGGGIIAETFNSSATGATRAVQQASGTFYITGAGDAAFQSIGVTNGVAAGSMTIAGQPVATQAWVVAQGYLGGANISYSANVLTLTGAGNGVVAQTFNSSATGATNAVQTAGGTFHITGAGDAAFQSLAVTNGAIATVFNSTATGATNAVQTAGGTFHITGAGDAAFQSVAVTNGCIAKTFNATATGATNAVQQQFGTFHITGGGDAAFQSVAVTNGVSAGSMTIAGQTVATQAWVTSRGYVTTSGVTGVKTSDGLAFANSGGYAILSFINSSGLITCGAINCTGGTINASNYQIGGVNGGSFTFQDLAGVTHTVSHGLLVS